MNKMNSADVLATVLEIRAKGVHLEARGGELVCTGPTAVLGSATVDFLKSSKEAVIALLEAESAVLDAELPDLTPEPDKRFDPFPLTGNQQAYWIGRDASLAYGRVGIHVYFEIEAAEFDATKFERCWQTLLERHDMLHAVVVGDGMQRFLDRYEPVRVARTDMRDAGREETERLLERLRADVSHKCYVLEEWPQTTFREVLTPWGTSVIFGSQDGWCIDGRSLQVMMQELADLYHDRPLLPPLDFTFRDYVNAMQCFAASPTYRRSLEYWREKVKTMPPAPVLPLAEKQGYAAVYYGDAADSSDYPNSPTCNGASGSESQGAPRFHRYETRLTERETASLPEQLKKQGLTLPSFLLTCFAETLGHWAEDPVFTINVPWGNRLPVHPDIDRCVGEFASMTMSRYDCSEGGSFADRARSMRSQVWEDLQHNFVSGVTVLREWRQANGFGPEATMPYVFTSEPEGRTPEDTSWIASLETIGTVRHTLTQTPQVWVDAQYGLVNGELHLSWDVLSGIFPKDLPGVMFDAYQELVRRLCVDDQIWNDPAPLRGFGLRWGYSEDQGQEVAIAAQEPVPILQQYADAEPGRMSVFDSQGSLTRAELLGLILALAEAVVNVGAGGGRPVAVLVPKGRWVSIAPFALRHAGAVFVPLDPEAPIERLKHLVADCGAILVVTVAACLETALQLGTAVLNAEKGFTLYGTVPNGPGLDRDIFALLYTSGSTGEPKGVMLPWSGILNLRDHMGRTLGLSSNDCVLALSPYYHDMALPEYAGNVLLGLSAVYPSPELKKDPAHWLELMRGHGVTFWHTVPAMMTMLLDYCDSSREGNEAFAALRVVVLGGDWIPINTAERFLRRAPSARLVGIGGPTEITVWNVNYPVSRIDPRWKSLPYGKTIQNCGNRVVDSRGHVRPYGVPGELWSFGPYLSAGYFADANSTRSSFITSPEGVRLFKTGDIVRMFPGGVMEFIGRKDQQVKIGGYRIELSEVEQALHQQEGVAAAVVCPVTGPAGGPVLHAWVIRQDGAAITAGQLRSAVLKTLPSYMCPAFIGFCDAYPMTANAKIDRKTLAALPRPHEENCFNAETSQARLLAGLWENVLGRAPETAESNFFESGGDSISAIRLLNKVAEAGLPRLNITAVFRFPTFSALAKHIASAEEEGRNEGLPPLRRAEIGADGIVPATRAQQRIWVDEQIHGIPGLYNLPFRFRLHGAIDSETVRIALDKAVNAFSALRTVFDDSGPDGMLLQRVLQHVDVPFSLVDYRGMGPEKAYSAWNTHARNKGAEAFAMRNGPLVRAELALLPSGGLNNAGGHADEIGALLLVCHHTVFDGWSMQLFLDRFQAALTRTEAPEPRFRYADYAVWERLPEVTAAMDEHAAQYAAALRALEADAACLPASRDATLKDNAGHAFLRHPMSDELDAAVRVAAAGKKITPFIFLLGVFSLVMSRYTGSDRIMLGTYSAQRFLPELDDVLGMLVNPLPLGFDFSAALSLDNVLDTTREALLLAKKHEMAPFESLVRATSPDGGSGGKALFSVTFSQDNASKTRLQAGGLVIEPEMGGEHKSGMDLEVSLHDSDGFTYEIVYDNRLFSRCDVERLFARLDAVTAQAVAVPDVPLSQLVYSLDEDECLWSEAHAATLERKSGRESLWEWFAARAGVNPGAVATIEEKDGLRVKGTYGELHRRALLTAGALSEAALDGEAEQPCRVALYLPRGMDLVAAMLGAWQQGWAVAPLSPHLPSERLQAILKQARPEIIITCRELAGAPLFGLLPQTLPVLVIEDIHNQEEDGLPEAALAKAEVPRPDPDASAWLLFTSGSTGKPKGVAISFRSLLNRLQWGEDFMPATLGELGCSKTDLAFGDYMCEFLGPILWGFPVYFVPEQEIKHIDSLYAALQREGVTRLVAVPVLLRELAALADSRGETFSCIRYLTSSGEPLSATLAEKLSRIFPEAAVYNVYGSTETVCDAAWYRLPRPAAALSAIPAGRPIAGGYLHVLDPQGVPLPTGMKGEICVVGLTVSQGYLDEETGGVSMRDGFGSYDGKPAFRTGDMGTWLDDGNLLCLGRADRQLKIRGQRLAPQEVENLLFGWEGVSQAAVLAVSLDGDDVLVACLETEDGAIGIEPIPGALRQALESALPPAFVPRYLFHADALDLTGTGKIDYVSLRRRVLDALAAYREFGGAVTPDLGGHAGILAEGWREFLKVPPTNASHFFHDGGNSLLAVRMAHFVEKRLRVPLRVRDLYATPTFSDLSALINSRLDQNAIQGSWVEL